VEHDTGMNPVDISISPRYNIAYDASYAML
jgi:hypothetical protein